MDKNKKPTANTAAASTAPSVNELELLKAENAKLTKDNSDLLNANAALKEQLTEQKALSEAFEKVIDEQTEELEGLKSTPKLPGEDSSPSFEFSGTTYRVVHGVSTRLNGSNLMKVSPAFIAENKALRERLVLSGSSAVVKA